MLDDLPLEQLHGDFATAQQNVFGFTMQDPALAIEAVSVEAISRGAAVSFDGSPVSASELPADEVSVFLSGEWSSTPVWTRDEMPFGTTLERPALIVEPHATPMLEAGWRA